MAKEKSKSAPKTEKAKPVKAKVVEQPAGEVAPHAAKMPEIPDKVYEKELQKLLQKTDAKGEKKEAKNQDIILNEALNILSDFTILQQKPTDVLTAEK